jgi:hypothetical protein
MISIAMMIILRLRMMIEYRRWENTQSRSIRSVMMVMEGSGLVVVAVD